MTRWRRIIRSVLRILAGVPIVCLLGCGILFLLFSVTWKGRCVGLSAVMVGGVLYCTVGYWDRAWFQRRRRRIYAILLPLALLLYLVPMWFAPTGGSPTGRVRHCFLHGQHTFARYSPWNVIPEIDQLNIGMTLMPLGDPHLSVAGAQRLRANVRPMYAAMEEDADFRELGSVMGLAYRNLLHLPFATGHYYAALPDSPPQKKLPCLILLHGTGGNTKASFWTLRRLAQQNECVVLAPSFGMGSWDKPGGTNVIVQVAEEAAAALPVDPQRIFLLGYSNGAIGVTRAAIRAPQRFRGLIYLSPVTEDELFSTPEFMAHIRGRRILFMHGANDEGIPCNLVKGSAAFLKGCGADLTLKIFADADHFALYAQPDAVLDEIRRFIAETPAVAKN